MSAQTTLLGELLVLSGPQLPVLMEDGIVHAAGHPFCCDPGCPCHQDLDHLAEVYLFVSDGLMTTQEAELFVAGKTV